MQIFQIFLKGLLKISWNWMVPRTANAGNFEL